MSPTLPSVVAVLGNDDGLVQEAALKWYGKLTDGTSEFSHEILDGSVSLVEEAVRVIRSAMEGLQTLSFFGGRKVVWLKGCSFLGDSAMGRSQDTLDALEELLQYVQTGMGDACLLITAYEVDKRRSFYKSLGKVGKLEEYAKPDISRDGWQADVSDTVSRACSERGLSFEREALDLFVNRVSESSRQIFSELDKLDLYLGPDRRTITEQDVFTMVPLTRSGVIFEIGRALEKGEIQKTLFLIDRQLEKGEQPVAVMRAAIIPVIRNLFAASVIVEEFRLPTQNYNAFSSALASLPEDKRTLVPRKKDGGPNAYPLFLAVQQLGGFTRAWLRKALTACFEADKSLVTSGLDNTVVLHRLVVQLCDRGKKKTLVRR